jgi:MFS-type transporter involved in bile tolerance (Atg22 family)
MQMNVWVLGGALALIGGIAGVMLGQVARKRRQNTKVVACVFLIAAAFQVFIVVTHTAHPVANCVCAAVLTGAAIGMLRSHAKTDAS